jgi:hypothetical protein
MDLILRILDELCLSFFQAKRSFPDPNVARYTAAMLIYFRINEGFNSLG